MYQTTLHIAYTYPEHYGSSFMLHIFTGCGSRWLLVEFLSKN